MAESINPKKPTKQFKKFKTNEKLLSPSQPQKTHTYIVFLAKRRNIRSVSRYNIGRNQLRRKKDTKETKKPKKNVVMKKLN